MFEISSQDPSSRARSGYLRTPHGVVETPSYVIVATHAEVRTLRPEDIPQTNTQMLIANTYHLWRDLGTEGLSDYPGLHTAIGWPGPIMTDSGGFQVFSLGFLREKGLRRGGTIETPRLGEGIVRVTEAGVYFRPDDSNTEEYLDAELSIKIQEDLQGDIVVAFDEPTSPAAGYEETEAAMQRTHKWAERSLEARYSKQKIYGVVQGGAFKDLRKKSAEFIGAMEFDGLAIGSTYGDAYGGTKAKTMEMLEWSIPYLPIDKPRHLFGVGRIEDLLSGVEAGIDTFDCVIPTREARHGRIWTRKGPVDVKKSIWSESRAPLDEECSCPVCALGTSRSHLQGLFRSKDMEAGRLATIHNVYFFNDFMARMREAIKSGEFAGFKKEVLRALKLQSPRGRGLKI